MEFIKPIKKKVTIDNGTRVIKNFWSQQESYNFKNSNNNMNFLSHAQLGETIKLITRKCIYIQSNRELDYEFIEVLNQLWLRGIKIYILTNKLYNSYKDTLVGRALIRYSNSITGDLFLIDGNTSVAKGYISDTTYFNKEKQYFSLNYEQIEECYEMFVFKFWKRTDFECIDKESFIYPIEVDEAPFDIFPKLNSKYIICDEYISGNIIEKIDKVINDANRKITLFMGELDIKNILLEKIVEKDNNNLKIEIISNIDKGLEEAASLLYPTEVYDIYATECKVFPMIIVDDTLVVIFTEEIKNESVLNSFYIVSDESILINKALNYRSELVLNSKTYLYNSEEKLDAIRRKKIIIDINNIQSSEKEVKDVEDIYGESETCENLDDLYNKVSKRDVEFSNKYSKIINYSYDLMPKYRDKSFSKDKTYDMWKGIYDNIELYCEELENEIKLVVNENSGILSSLFSFMKRDKINANNTLKELNGIKKDLENRCYSIDKLKAFDTIIKKAYDDYIKLNSDIEEMKKYNEELDIWNNKKQDILENINKLQKKVFENKNEINGIKRELSNKNIIQIEEIILNKEMEFKEVKENFIIASSSLKTYFESEEKLTNFKNYIESLNMKNNKKKKDIDKVVDKVKEMVNIILNDEQYFDKNYKNKINNAKNPALITTLIKGTVLNDLKEFITKGLTETDKIGLEILEELSGELYGLSENLKEEKNKTNSTELNKELLSLEKELQKLEISNDKLNNELEKLGSEFEYKPSNKEAKGLKIRRYEVKLINEELPKVGVLYKGKNGRQLAINKWRELKVGQEEAKRLNAELVCEIIM